MAGPVLAPAVAIAGAVAHYPCFASVGVAAAAAGTIGVACFTGLGSRTRHLPMFASQDVPKWPQDER